MPSSSTATLRWLTIPLPLRRWRSEFRTDALFLEIKFVLERFCQPYLSLFQASSHSSSPASTRQANLPDFHSKPTLSSPPPRSHPTNTPFSSRPFSSSSKSTTTSTRKTCPNSSRIVSASL